MRILGIDYGRRKIGLAIAEGTLADPFKVIRYDKVDEVIKKLNDLVISHEIEKIVVGISEGKMEDESRDFSLKLGKSLKVPVETYDETLTTYEAQVKSIESGMKMKKRKEMEDAFAACVMLQSYLEANHV